MEHKLPLLVYDAECPLCVRFKQGIERLVTGDILNYAAVQDESIYAQFPYINPQECQTVVHLLLADGSVLKGPEVLPWLIKLNPLASRLAWLLDSEVGKRSLNFFYQQVETIRERLHKDDDCPKCKKSK